MKRNLEDEKIISQSCTSVAANFNAKVLRKLQKAFAANPDTDLLSIFPTGYSARLNRMKTQKAGRGFCLILYFNWQSVKIRGEIVLDRLHTEGRTPSYIHKHAWPANITATWPHAQLAHVTVSADIWHKVSEVSVIDTVWYQFGSIIIVVKDCYSM